MPLGNAFIASRQVFNSIETVLECKKNEEALVFYRGGKYLLSQDFKSYYAPIWHSMFPESREQHTKGLRDAAVTTAVEQTFANPMNAERKSIYEQRISPQCEPSVILELCNVGAVTKTPQSSW